VSPLRLCLWSGPRNVSTALMYSFAQRADTRVVDEPLYAHYLRVSGAAHPGREVVLAGQDGDGERVVREVVLGPVDRPVHFQKHMAHHLLGLDRGFLDRTVNVLLVRDPRERIPSLVHQIPAPTLADTGLGVQTALYDELVARGQDPPVLDARLLLEDPPGVLRALCARVGIPFDPAMLSWPPGPRKEDGVWAPYWYHRLHESTGFARYVAKEEPVPEAQVPLWEEARPHYARLRARAIAGED